MQIGTNRRKWMVIVLGVCLLLLFTSLAGLNAFNLKVLNPSTLSQFFVFIALSTVAFLLLVAVLVLLVRNVLKLYADQRSRVLGARLRTRMLWGAVLVSLVPIAFMFLFSYLLMNRAVDRWFSQPVTEMRDDSIRMALELSRYTTTNARAEAESIALSLPSDVDLASNGNLSGIITELQHHEITLQGGFVAVFHDDRPIAAFHVPQKNGAAAEVKDWVPPSDAGDDEAPPADVRKTEHLSADPAKTIDADILQVARRSDAPIFSIGDIDYALGMAALKQRGTVVVGMPMPHGLSANINRLQDAAQQYQTLYRDRRIIRNQYMLLLLMLTGLALFASTWLALYLSKQVTRPVEALADAMEEIAAGHYGHRVGESATEELGELVQSFNRMAEDLETSRAQVEHSTVKLSAANAALDARRRELETMLETIPNGVVTLDAERRIVLANRALSEMVDPGGQQPFIGMPITSVFPADAIDALDRLIRRSHRMGSASGEFEMAGVHGALNLAATVALLESSTGSERIHLGYVLVLEDATELLRAQKQSAWKEVARRVAHEIKNPLTPIALSAEQIHRHIDRLAEPLAAGKIESTSPAIIRRCSEVITASVETMRALVDQFAALAEFPSARPRPADLNTIVENSLALFAGRLQNIQVITRLAPSLPLVMGDPEALKRALSNLIDNAAEAMQNSLLRELRVSTALLDNGMVELVIADTGPGLTDEMRERLFLPYFSTKQRGTGLGLAIAAKIVQEHQGTIRAEKNSPAGAKFIVELRAATGTDSEAEMAGTTTGESA